MVAGGEGARGRVKWVNGINYYGDGWKLLVMSMLWEYRNGTIRFSTWKSYILLQTNVTPIKKTTKKKHLTTTKIQKQERNKRQGKGRSESIVMELIFDSVICKRKGPLTVAGLQGWRQVRMMHIWVGRGRMMKGKEQSSGGTCHSKSPGLEQIISSLHRRQLTVFLLQE